MASYTQPTGFLAASFPATVSSFAGGSVASVTGAVGSVTAAVTLPTIPTNWITADGIATDALGSLELADAVVTDIVSQVAAQITTDHGSGSYLTATGFSTHTAADVTTALEADGSKLDHVWEMTEDGGGVRRYTTNALEQAPTGGGGSTDWTADERTALRAILGIPASGTTPDDPTSGILDTIRDDVGTAQADLDIITGADGVNLLSGTQASIDATEADTNELQTDWADGGRLDLLVDGIITAISGLENLSASEVNAELLDVLTVDNFAELGAPPAASSSLKDKLTWLFMWARNKSTETSTERKLFADDEATVVSTEGVSDDGTTFTKTEAV